MSAWRTPPAWTLHVALAALVLCVYAPVRHFPFVVYDDHAFVSENPTVLGGLSAAGVARAFTQSAQGNYVPLAWLSHMLDVELFGLDAGAHHAVNLLLHLASTLLLFEVLRRASAGTWPSAFTAALFGVHPTHVESVAWVAERRDVLSGLFFVLCLGAYTGWTRAGGARRYALLLLCFTLGLLAKPMLVTLPCLLLLLDLWPLRRTQRGAAALVLEKLPLLLPAAVVSGLALATQQGAMPSLAELPLATRLANAALAYAAYLRDALWPLHLAVFHPLDLDPPAGRAVAAALLFAALSAAALLCWRRRPWITVGWLWFAGMLVPVIGLVQVGSQSMADRYVYLPGIGLSLAVSWSAAEAVERWPRARPLLAAAGLAGLAACLYLGRAQVDTWRDSVALFEHARAVTGPNAVVELNLAEAYDEAGDAERALAHYEQALHWYPGARGAHARMGALLVRRGEPERGTRHLLLAMRLDPLDPAPRVELATLLLRSGKLEPATLQLERALELDPDDATARYHLAELRALAGQGEQAAQLFSAALRARPPAEDAPVADKHPAVLAALAEGCAEAGRLEAAERWSTRALTLARLAGQPELVARLESDLRRYQAATR